MNRSMTENQMMVIPLKVTQRYDIKTPLAAWIDKSKDLNVNSRECRNDLLRLASIRNCISTSICASYAHKSSITENAMEDCMEYHAVLMECENIGVPIVEELGLIDLKISWDCAFQRQSQPMIRSNIRHERICVLFNIGALESYLASTEDLLKKEGLAKAAQRYNTSAGIFNHIRTELLSIPKDPNPSIDISPAGLEMCEILLLAQGQACVYDMARTHDKPVHSVLAKLAMGAAELYGEAVLKANDRMVQSLMDESKRWIRCMKVQSATFRALSEYHESVVARESSKNIVGAHGAEIARLQLTETLCDDGIKLDKNKAESLQILKRNVKERLRDAEKDNRELYRDSIPGTRSLPPSQGRRMVKLAPLKEALFPSSLSRPIFTNIKRS